MSIWQPVRQAGLSEIDAESGPVPRDRIEDARFFKILQREVLRLSPAGRSAFADNYRDAFLAHPPITFLDCVK